MRFRLKHADKVEQGRYDSSVLMILGLFLAASTPVVMPPARVPAAYVGRTVLNNPHISEKVIALTFDDGPSPFTTPRVLATLRRFRAHATFFLVGEMVKGRERIVRRMVQDGNVLGNHTYTHPYHPDRERAAWELKATNRAIYKAVGSYPGLVRPPGGVMTSWTARLAKAQGYPSVIWTGDSGDTQTHDVAAVYRRVVGSAHPGAIILMHDVKEHTTRALPAIMATLKKRGYRFVTVPEMLRVWQRASDRASLGRLASSGKQLSNKVS